MELTFNGRAGEGDEQGAGRQNADNEENENRFGEHGDGKEWQTTMAPGRKLECE
jgi:hypothetical protein